ncbi:DNA glycosylase AlkZ-like family protein [Dactylosporangium cerinum]
MRHVTDQQRRARLAVRHALTAAARVGTPEAATTAMTVLHATEPATVHLSCWARVTSVTVADVDRVLYGDRTLVKQLAMRRTLFVFPRDLLPAAWGARPRGSPPTSAPAWPRTSSPRASPPTAPPGLTAPAPRSSTPSPESPTDTPPPTSAVPCR